MAAAALAIYTFYAAAQLRAFGWDVALFACFGDTFTDPNGAPDGVTVHRNSDGYDGQFFYRLAVAPFSREERAAGVRFDFPVYRMQRIGYPLLAFATSGGHPRAALWTLLLMNVVALAIVAGLAAAATDSWSGLAAALHPGFVLTVTRDLAEATEAAFVVGAVLALTRGRKVAAALLLTAGVLSKETAVFAAVAFLGADVLQRRLDRGDAVYLLPIGVFFGWKALLFQLWGFPFNFGASEHVGLPFGGFVAKFVEAFAAGAAERVLVLEMLLLAAFLILVLRASFTSTMPLGVKLACLAYGALLFTLGRGFWVEDWAFLRAATGFVLLGILIGLTSPHRRTVFALTAASWLALAGHVLRWR